MSNDYEIVLAAPLSVASPTGAAVEVVDGLIQLGFRMVPGFGDKVFVCDRRFGRDIGKPAMGWLKEQVLALPWRTWSGSPGLDLTVLWQDDHTMEDDSMMGRKAPYAWRQETWEVRP